LNISLDLHAMSIEHPLGTWWVDQVLGGRRIRTTLLNLDHYVNEFKYRP